MTNYLVISDVHANPEALRRLWDFVQHHYPETDIQVRCLGDIIGYGHAPVEAFQLVSELDPEWRAGNHDLYYGLLAAGREQDWDSDPFSKSARDILLMHRERFAVEHVAFPDIADLRRRAEPRVEDADGYRLVFVHASPVPTREGYVARYLLPDRDLQHVVSALQELVGRFDNSGRTLLFTGHTHVPMLLYANDPAEPKAWPVQYATRNDVLPVVDLNRLDARLFVVNGGAVNMPRDGVTVTESDNEFRASGVIFESDTHLLRYVQVQYNYRLTIWQAIAHDVLLPLAEKEQNDIERRYLECLPHRRHERFFYSFTATDFRLKNNGNFPEMRYPTPLIQHQIDQLAILSTDLEGVMSEPSPSTLEEIQHTLQLLQHQSSQLAEQVASVDVAFPETRRVAINDLLEKSQERLSRLDRARLQVERAERLAGEYLNLERDLDRCGDTLSLQELGVLKQRVEQYVAESRQLSSRPALPGISATLEESHERWISLSQHISRRLAERMLARRKVRRMAALMVLAVIMLVGSVAVLGVLDL